MSWKDTKSKCLRLQFPSKNDTSLKNATTARNNKSYWLGIYKKDTCRPHKVEDLANVMELELNRCPYVENSNSTIGEEDCDMKNYAICVKPGTSSTVNFELLTFENWIRKAEVIV